MLYILMALNASPVYTCLMESAHIFGTIMVYDV